VTAPSKRIPASSTPICSFVNDQDSDRYRIIDMANGLQF
jgi:hypothetical protein